VLTRDSFETVTLPVGEQSLQMAIAEFRRFDSLDSSAPPSLRSLYDWLIAPVEAHLKTRQIGIVPHGPLHYLPFAALPVSPSSALAGNAAKNESAIHYLGDDYALFYLPNASVLPFLHAEGKDVDTADVLAFSFAAPSGFESLAYADQEAQEIATLFNSPPLIGADASERAFKQRAGDHRIVHVAAHGEFNLTNAQFSRLVLAPGQDEDGSLEVHEVYGLNLEQTDLVVLSACETQLGKQSQGDDIVALNRAFLYAGTPTVIASLWAVNDEATSTLMQSFYKHLKQGDSKADALRQAQMETRVRFPHPYYWAAFVLTGSPGTPSDSSNILPIGIAATVVILVLALLAVLFVLRKRARLKNAN
jgi:CHAT domain-containing protein